MDKREFEFLKSNIRDSYYRRTEDTKKIWKGFDNEVKKLTDIVKKEFGEILKEIGPVVTPWWEEYSKGERAKVVDYTVSYDPERDKFSVKINKIRAIKGIFNTECPHVFLEPITGFDYELDPRIKNFKEKYNLSYIQNPDNVCEHK